jgi:Short C-terminal domain
MPGFEDEDLVGALRSRQSVRDRDRGSARRHPPERLGGCHAGEACDQVRQLAQLRDEGLLTEEEFERKRKELLGL